MTGSRPPRRAGSPWRVLAHEWLGRSGATLYGRSFHVGNDPNAETKAEATILPGTEIDEVVIGRWLHLEQMDTGTWLLNVGGVVIDVKVDRDGRPRLVVVHGPDDYDGRREGCEYRLHWSGAEADG